MHHIRNAMLERRFIPAFYLLREQLVDALESRFVTADSVVVSVLIKNYERITSSLG
jgi:hypothetical protein